MSEVCNTRQSDHYVPALTAGFVSSVVPGYLVERYVQNGPYLAGLVPEEVYNHAGNAWVGGVIGLAGLHATREYFTHRNRQTGETRVAEGQLPAARRFASLGAAALAFVVNQATETQWGVDNLPIAQLYDGVTPDMVDTFVSTGIAGAVGYLMWRRAPSRVSEGVKRFGRRVASMVRRREDGHEPS